MGLPATIRGAWDATRRGGTTCVVSVGRLDAVVPFSAFELFFNERTLVGSVYGSADVRRDVDRMVRLWRAGRLEVEGMVTKRVGLTDINAALDDLRHGRVIRTVVDLG